MSNIQRFENLKQVVELVQPQFDELARIHGAVNYKKEASFALQALSDNDYLASMAIANQDSLKRAIVNIAAIGLTLNPVYKLAYLVPRDKKVMLDLSYRGYIQLATDCGAIKWAHAEVVCENDKFQLTGLGNEPIHHFQPFGERGAIIGAYCCAKTHDGDYITSVMSIKEVHDIRNRSQSWKSGKNSPWQSDENEMIKKTVIRKAYKSWPMTDTRKRFDQAIDVTNEADPVEFVAIPALIEKQDITKPDNVSKVIENLTFLDRPLEKYIVHLAAVTRREIKSLEDLTESEMDQAIIQLNQWTEIKKAKEVKKEVINENAAAN